MGVFDEEEENYFNSFAEVLFALRMILEKSEFPQLETVRYGEKIATWDWIFEGQDLRVDALWGSEEALKELGIEFFDGAGVKWVQSLAGKQYQNRFRRRGN